MRRADKLIEEVDSLMSCVVLARALFSFDTFTKARSALVFSSTPKYNSSISLCVPITNRSP